MECGSQDFFCQVANWLSENDLAFAGLVDFLGKLGERASGITGTLAHILREYGQTIVGVCGLVFGAWRWWAYREQILHERLARYLSDSDARLKDGHSQVLAAIQRPGPGISFQEPLFVDQELRSVLRERRWDAPLLALNVHNSTDWQLTSAIERITRRLKTLSQNEHSLHEQLSVAFSLRGALAASRANRSGSESRAGEDALTFFRSALSVPGHQQNLVLKELEGHQLRKLGHTQSAEQAYTEALKLAEALDNPRERTIITARVRRYLAEMNSNTAPLVAYMMLTSDTDNRQYNTGALPLILGCEPLSPWERLELAEMHYLSAMLANRLNFVGRERQQLKSADDAYRRILLDLPKPGWFRTQFRALRKKAEQGCVLVEDAKKGAYDPNWLG